MSTDIDIPSTANAVQRAEFISQVTAIEQARAVAEVQAAVIVAQQVPRDIHRARAEVEQACSRMALAQRSFYSVPNRGNGPTVHLARELARIWGNLTYGVHELSRDDVKGMSEIRAFAWDLQTNTRSERTFQVPHERMVGKSRVKLIDLGDIYLSNQNIGARAVRECIFTVIPTEITEDAMTLCRKTLDKGEGRTIEERRASMVEMFATIDVSLDQLEARLGRKQDDWRPSDVAQMGIVFTSIKRDGLDRDEEFPPIVVTVADITATVAAPTPAGPVSVDDIIDTPAPTPAPDPAPEPSPLATTKPRQPRVPTNKAGDPAGAEYGDVKGAQSLEGVLSPEQMIVKLAAAHGVESGDAVARMSSQILGREVVGPVDFNGAETARVKRALEALDEDEPFQFAKTKPADPAPSGDEIVPATSPQDADEWRALMAECSVSPTVLVSHVRERFPEFKGYSDIGLLGIGGEVAAWVRAQKPAES